MKKKSAKTVLLGFFAALACLCCLSAIGMSMVRAGAEEVSVMMEPGASVRYKEEEETDRSGIRFTAYISETYKSENPEAQYGMLLCPVDLLGESELTAETENAVNKVTEVWSEENDKEGYAKFTTVLYNIPESEYGRTIAARAYIKNGEEYVYAQSTEKRSLGQVASLALAAGDDRTEELNDYVDKAVNVFNAENLTIEKGDTAKLSVEIEPAELVPVIKSGNEQIVTIEDGKAFGAERGTAEISVTLGSVKKTIKVTVKETLSEETFSQYAVKGEIDLAETGAEIFDLSGAYEITGTDPSGSPVTAEGTKFLASENGNYVFDIGAKDENGNVIATQKVTIALTVFDDLKALYETALAFDGEESLAYVSAANKKIVEDEDAEGGYALEATFDNINSSGNQLKIDLGGNYRLSEIMSVKVSFKIVYGDGTIWYKAGVNGTSTKIDWYNMMKAATNNAQSNENKVMEDYVTVEITQEYLKGGYESSTPLEEDALIQSLVFWDASNRTDATKYTTVRIADIEIVLNPTKEEISDLLKFNEENSLELITSGVNASIVEDADAEGGYALEGTFQNYKSSGKNALTISLGGVYKVSEISTVKISYKIIKGSGSVWYKAFLNGSKELDWYSLMKTATAGSVTNSNKVFEEYVTIEITAEYFEKAGLTDEDFVQSLTLSDETARDASYGDYSTTVRIGSIKIETIE